MQIDHIARFFLKDFVIYFRRHNKKSTLTQAAEALMLWRYYKYAPYHYFKTPLYLHNALGDEAILDHVPPRLIQDYTLKKNSLGMRLFRDIVVNKVSFQNFMEERGLPCVATLGVVEEDGRLVSRDGNALDLAALYKAATISGSAIFLKPRRGAQGEGALVADVGSIGLDEIKDMPGYVIQPFIKQHTVLKALFPRSVNTVRIDTFFDEGRLTHNAAVLRIGAGDSPIDNWSTGGIAVGIDLQSGRLMQTGWQKNPFGDGAGYQAHPDTGIQFLHYQIPYWEECKALVRSAASLLQPLVSLGWDVVITPRGPVLLEVNDTWSVNLMQTAWGGLRKTLIGKRALEARAGHKVVPDHHRADFLSP